MRRKIIMLLFILLLTACSNSQQPVSLPKEAIEPRVTLDQVIPEKIQISPELEMFTQSMNDTYFGKYGKYLFTPDNWWIDYGADHRDSNDQKGLHRYVYLADKRSYLDPNITVNTDKNSGSIISISVNHSSTERFTEQTAQTFTEYFYCVAKVLMPDISDDYINNLFEDIQENENRIDHNAEPYPATLYFTDKIYCYAYFKDGAETIFFGTEVSDKLPEYKKRNVKCIEIAQENVLKTEVDFSSYFDGMTGTAVFLNKSGEYTVYNKAGAELRASPCSTFKIISTLAALEYGTVTPSRSDIPWDGTKWKFDSWNKDLNLTEAFQNSCVWYYRKLTDRIGKDKMTEFVEKLDYGNNDTSQWEGSGFNNNPLIDGFWLESSLKISPQEQVDVLFRIFEGNTEIDKNNISALKKMMYKEGKGFALYGKTGTGKGGWFVGFFEVNGNNTYFAVYLNEQEGANGPKAQEIVSNIISGYFNKEA